MEPDLSLESIMHDDTQRRISALEASVASVSATVEGLVTEWRHERDDLKDSISSINRKLDSNRTSWKDAIPVFTGMFIAASVGVTFVQLQNFSQDALNESENRNIYMHIEELDESVKSIHARNENEAPWKLEVTSDMTEMEMRIQHLEDSGKE